MLVLIGRSFHGLDIYAYSSPELGRLDACWHISIEKETLKPWKVTWTLVDDIGQTGCEVKLHHQVGKTDSVSTEKTGERSSCYTRET